MNEQSGFKQADASSYDDVVEKFDRLAEDYASYAVGPMLKLAGLEGTDNAIDIGCGSGLVTLSIAKKLDPGGHITGVDLSDGMLEFAKAKATRMGLSEKVSFLKSDAEKLGLPSKSADAIVSLYALRHLPNPQAAIDEIFRVLKPGGRTALAVGSSPKLVSAAGVVAGFRKLGDLIASRRGRLLTASEHIDGLVDYHLPTDKENEITEWSSDHHEFSRSLNEMVKQAGFVSVQSNWFGKEYSISNAEEFWTIQATFSSKARKRLAQANQTDVALLRERFNDDCERTLASGGRLIYRVGALMVSARKPSPSADQ